MVEQKWENLCMHAKERLSASRSTPRFHTSMRRYIYKTRSVDIPNRDRTIMRRSRCLEKLLMGVLRIGILTFVGQTSIGKVDEILGPITQVYFTIKTTEGIQANSFKTGDKFYIGGDKLLPLEKFLPKPKPPPGAAKPKRAGGARGGRGGPMRGGRGGGRGAPRGRGGFSAGGRGGGRGGSGGFSRGGSGGGFTPRGRGGFTPRGRGY